MEPTIPGTTSDVVVTIGSRIRFSTALLRQIDATPNQQSRLAEVERIIREPDGTMTIYLKNADWAF
jgi:hypothetical protein